MTNPKNLIIGIGNTLMSDDGLGAYVIDLLSKQYSIPDHIMLVDGGTQGVELFNYFDQVENVIIIDAILSKDKVPGSVVKIEKENIFNTLVQKMSVHEIRITDLLSSLELLGKTPENICMIGIVPEKLEFSYGLSNCVKENIDKVIPKIFEQLKEWKIIENQLC